ncbi:hypothetical protein BJ138DRAFT_1016618 [Hygrophoropsis aurantiaca]|uniref:Uncharacterized protein n=1 Tax=Hygrophoropsis aurantiaca TaxID=72124 RepID=A0ACB7ZZ89_9AGAM|nr:hypothetical protein BJ138DRAFT_1016618 [Hygrophoropsis aurantiaca]
MTSEFESASPGAMYNHGHHESVPRSHSWRTAAISADCLLPFLKPDTRDWSRPRARLHHGSVAEARAAWCPKR